MTDPTKAANAATADEKLYTQADLDFFSANADEYAAMAFRYSTALRAIKENAESWHGNDGLQSGHARALAVIAKWAKEALDGED